MAKFQIKVTKDFSTAKKSLPKVGFIIYQKVIDGIYNGIIMNLAKKRLADYSPEITKDTATFSETSEDLEFLKKEKEKLEVFLYGDFSELRDLPEIKRAFSNRWAMKLYNKFMDFMEDRLRQTVLGFLICFSLKVEYQIIEEKK